MKVTIPANTTPTIYVPTWPGKLAANVEAIMESGKPIASVKSVNDVIRVGETFYMMSSTCHFVPGMIILKSKDLVNCEFSNAITP